MDNLSRLNETAFNLENAKRKTDIRKIIEVLNAERDSILLSVYDNGELDGDSVSVYLDDSIIVQNRLLSTNPINLYLSLSKKKYFQTIKMVAENLGTIPPNTAVMILNTNKKRYEVRPNSDYEKNAFVEFILTE